MSLRLATIPSWTASCQVHGLNKIQTFSTSAAPLSRHWSRLRIQDYLNAKNIRKRAKKAVFTDTTGTSARTSSSSSLQSSAVLNAKGYVSSSNSSNRVILLRRQQQRHQHHDRNQHDNYHTGNSTSFGRSSGDNSAYGHYRWTSRLHHYNILPPLHHRRHFLHRQRILYHLRQQQLYSHNTHRQKHGHHRINQHSEHNNRWWWDQHWNPWVLHMIDSRRVISRAFFLGIFVTGGSMWMYKAKQNQWEQWNSFLEDLREIKGMFINPAKGSSFAPLRPFSTSVLAEAATHFQSESPVSQGLHGSQKRLKMLTPNLVELRLAQHQGSFKAVDGQEQKESSKKTGPGLIQGYSVNQLPSNNPIEDDLSRHVVRNEDGEIERLFFGVFDGHSGWCCSQKVAQELAPSVARELDLVKNSNDTKAVIEAIERGFLKLDHRIVHDSVQRVLEHPSQPLACASLLPALSGSCALMAYVDTKANDLYVACAGDSRAVMGVRESTSEGGHVWRAVPLSIDQTGRNKREVKRLQAEHPGEENTVVMRGRVLGGLEPTRAFGDARYKWSKEIQDKVFALFPAYRQPPRNYKTPPYVTAKPVVRHHRIQPEDRFLVMATDGLWDKLTSEEVVQLVGNLLDGKIGQEEMILDREEIQRYRKKLKALEAAKGSIGTDQQQEEDIDEELTPPNLSPKGPASQVRKFTYRDHTNASTHLIRNALGGADDDKVAATLSIPSPISRAYRDDITVAVIFFGPQDTTLALSDAYEFGGFVDI